MNRQTKAHPLRIDYSLLFEVGIPFLLVLCIFSFGLIAMNESLVLQINSAGFNNFLEIFRFPVNCLVAALALATIYLTLMAVKRATAQNNLAYTTLLQSSFLAYAACDTKLPISAVKDRASLRPHDDWQSFPHPIYTNPIVSFRRLYESAEGAHLQINPKIKEDLKEIRSHYRAYCGFFRSGDVLWLRSLARLLIVARQVRQSLLVETTRSKKFDSVIVLETSNELGKEIMPPAECDTLSSVIDVTRHDLYCILHVLFFSPELEQWARTLALIAENISIFGRADSKLQKIFQEKIPFSTLWRETHRIQGCKVELENI